MYVWFSCWKLLSFMLFILIRTRLDLIMIIGMEMKSLNIGIGACWGLIFFTMYVWKKNNSKRSSLILKEQNSLFILSLYDLEKRASEFASRSILINIAFCFLHFSFPMLSLSRICFYWNGMEWDGRWYHLESFLHCESQQLKWRFYNIFPPLECCSLIKFVSSWMKMNS